VVVAVALSLWIGWSREAASLRETAARETGLRERAVIQRDAAKKILMKVQSDNAKLRLESDKREFEAKHERMRQEQLEHMINNRQAAANKSELSNTPDKENP